MTHDEGSGDEMGTDRCGGCEVNDDEGERVQAPRSDERRREDGEQLGDVEFGRAEGELSSGSSVP